MNTKKCLVAALAAAVAVSASAVSVSAIAPGVTDATAKDTVVVELGKVTHFHVDINDVSIDADVPADAIAAGEALTFGAATITNVDIEAAVAALPDVATSEILDIFFLDEDGNNVSFNSVGVDMTVTTTTTAYETLYIFDEASGLVKLADADGNKLSCKAPHFSYYVLTKTGTPEEPSQESQQSQQSVAPQQSQQSVAPQQSQQASQQSAAPGVNTGDSAATAAVFAIIGAAALGTALVASKSKKYSK